MAAVSRPVAFLAAIGVVAILALVLNPSDAGPKAPLVPKKRRTAKKAGTADWDLPPPDPTVHFAPVAGTPRNVFVPLVATVRPLTLPKLETKDDLVQIPAKLAGGEGAWAYTGMVEANGVRMALLENKGLNQSGYVREGELWKTARVVGITSACIVLADDKGATETVFRFDPNAPPKPKAEPGSAPSFGPGGIGAPPVGPINPGGTGFPIRPTLTLPDPTRTVR